MTSDVLTRMGLGIDIGYLIIVMFVLIIVLIVLLTIFIIREVKLQKKYNIFMKGSSAESLEDAIAKLFEDNNKIKKVVNANRGDIRQIYRVLTRTFQKIGIVKYDAYQQMGGLLSFSLAMLDEENNGFILNSVHTSDGCYTYTKEIHEGKCELELGNEEMLALEKAIGSEEL